MVVSFRVRLLFCVRGFEKAAAEYVDNLGRVLTGQLHLAHHTFMECAVLNLSGRK